MNLFIEILAGISGFILGFAGWPCVFVLTGSLGRLLTSSWDQRSMFSGYVTWICIRIFFISIMFSMLGFYAVVFLSYGEFSWKEMHRIVFGSSFFGFFSYGALPMIEAKIRGTARYRRRSGKA
ncbi:MAG: hypothetical protein HC897_15505 [Thermoanaerobaculia bacterium]|nr:hypothetical protein [Thermoanaerobaculia bacterium]